MSLADKFQIVERPYGSFWLHKEKPMFIAHYPDAPRKPHYQAYRPADWVGTIDLKGRDPWTVDCRKFKEGGYPTLEQAMQAVEDREWVA